MGKFDKRNERTWQWGDQPRKSFKAVSPIEAEHARQRTQQNEILRRKRREAAEARKRDMSNDAYGMF